MSRKPPKEWLTRGRELTRFDRVLFPNLPIILSVALVILKLAGLS